MHGARQLPRNGQPQSRTARLGDHFGAFPAFERLENAFEAVGRDPHAGVGHRHRHRIAGPPGGDRDRTLVGIFDGVAQQIIEHLLEPHRIGHHIGQRLGNIDVQRHRLAAQQRFGELHDVADRGRHMYRMDIEPHAPLPDAVDIDQIVHQPAQPPRRKGNQIELATLRRRQFPHGPRRQRLGNPDDPVERRPQFVARIGYERILEPVRLLQCGVLFLDQLHVPFELDILLPDQRQLRPHRVAHALETLGQPPQFGGLFHRGNRAFEIAGGYRFGHIGQLLQRRRHCAREKIGHPGQDRQRDGRKHQDEPRQCL